MVDCITRNSPWHMEEGMATHSCTLAWRIPCTEKPGVLWSTGLQRVEHDWSNSTHAHHDTQWWVFWIDTSLIDLFSITPVSWITYNVFFFFLACISVHIFIILFVMPWSIDTDSQQIENLKLNFKNDFSSNRPGNKVTFWFIFSW